MTRSYSSKTLTRGQKILRWAGRILLVLFVLMIISVYWLISSLKKEPEFYSEIGLTPRETLVRDSNQATQKMQQLHEELQNRKKEWNFELSQDEINGWLAVDLNKYYSNALPPGVHDPRMSVNENGIDFACRFKQGSIEGILHINGNVEMRDSNILEFEPRTIKVGSVPFSKDNVIAIAVDGMKNAGMKVEQTDREGKPIVLIHLDPKTKNGTSVILEHVNTENGRLVFSGKTQRK